jgi:nitrite reductase (NO-forming)
MKRFFLSAIVVAFVTAISFSFIPMATGTSTDGVDTEMMSPAGDPDLAASIKAGKAIYEGKGTCSVCHQLNGAGLPPTFPPLAGADYLLADKQRAVKQTMYGSKEPIKVNGVTYPGSIMTTVELSNEEVRDVVNYILNSWGNDGGSVTTKDVVAARKK